MFENRPAGMHADFDTDIALKSVHVDAVLNNLLCKTIMTQVYQNLEKKAIEAVYTFPVPSQATLLDLKICVGDRELKGVVVEKSLAESQYEDAVIEGDAAIMLEQVESGMYTLNVGNVLPGEMISITIQYAELFCWQGDTIRYFLPTTIAPRYGDPEKTGLQPHQIPESQILVENHFHLRITILGDLADALFQSPSHKIAIQKSIEKTVITLAAGQAFMDRDFILNTISAKKNKNMSVTGRDLDGGHVVLVSFVPSLAGQTDGNPRSIKILVDCSGSMAGDSINLAVQAISDFLGYLRPSDSFNVFAFGSTCRSFFEKQVPATIDNLTFIRRQLRSIEANMGGTEMKEALIKTINTTGPAIPQDIFLITDGEVWDADGIIRTVRDSGHRVFTVGVGSAVSEGFVRKISTETAGACEFVTPNETMTEKIVRHFNRIYLPRADKITVKWPMTPRKVVPQTLPPVFDRDTLHVFAFFDEKPEGNVTLKLNMANGQAFTQSAVLPDQVIEPASDETLPGTIPRLAIQKSLKDEKEKNVLAQALKYQLISSFTNYIIVADRPEDKKEQCRVLPALRKVPQMIAAGWGGTSKLAFSIKQERVAHSISQDNFDIPMFSRRWADEPPLSFPTTPVGFIIACNRFHRDISDYEDLLDCGLPDRILNKLQAIAKQYDSDLPETVIVTVFLNLLATSKLKSSFTRKRLRVIKKSFKEIRPENNLIQLIAEGFSHIKADDWGIKDD